MWGRARARGADTRPRSNKRHKLLLFPLRIMPLRFVTLSFIMSRTIETIINIHSCKANWFNVNYYHDPQHYSYLFNGFAIWLSVFDDSPANVVGALSNIFNVNVKGIAKVIDI